MLTISVPEEEFYDEEKEEFVKFSSCELTLEHSLVSISKWEAIWGIPFIENEDLTSEHFISYCRCMTVNRPKNPEVFNFIRREDVDKILRYMYSPVSAWTIRDKSKKKKGPKRTMCSEFFYWLMIQYNIPFECEKWYFGRLLALIDYCQSEGGSNEPAPKVSQIEQPKRYVELNMKRLKELKTTG